MTIQLTPDQLEIPLSLRLRLILSKLREWVILAVSPTSPEALIQEREFKSLLAQEDVTISRICFYYACSIADFDDLRQDALINIWRGMRDFRKESSQRTWVSRVTINSCLSTIRKQSRHQHESLENLYSLIDTDETNSEAIEQLHRLIASLGHEDKGIIMMWLDEMSYDDIAEVKIGRAHV